MEFQVISVLMFCLLFPISIAWAGSWCGQRLFYERPIARFGLCLAIATLAGKLIQLNGLANSKMSASRAMGPTDGYAEWMSGLSLIGLEICAAFTVGIALGWRSWKPWVRRILLGPGTMIVVAQFVLGAAAQSGDL